jgi:hypothetical protein
MISHITSTTVPICIATSDDWSVVMIWHPAGPPAAS